MKRTIWILALCLSIGFGFAQNINERIQQLSRLGKQPVEDYKVGPGDLLEITVFGEEKLSPTLRVSSSGEITLPFIESVQVAGMSPLEIEKELKKRLDGTVIHNPQVTVFVKEYRSQPIFVLGAVEKPGEYQMSRAVRVVDAIAMAGGLKIEKASNFAVIQRSEPIPGGDGSLVTKINLKDLLDKGEAELNLPLHAGDVVQIPERVPELFYVIGEVNRSGAFALPLDQKLLLSQALAWAGGPMKTAKLSKGVLVRYDERGDRQEMAVNFDDIMKGKTSDVEIRKDDVVFIPGSKFKTISYGLLGAIPSTVSGAIIYGPVRAN